MANDDSRGNSLQLEKRDVIAWCRPFLAGEHHLAVPFHQLTPRIEDHRCVIGPTVDPVNATDHSCDLTITAGLADLFFGGGDLFSAGGHYIYRVTRQSALWKGSDVHALFGKALQRLHDPAPVFGYIK
jgi:hypothetical protein